MFFFNTALFKFILSLFLVLQIPLINANQTQINDTDAQLKTLFTSPAERQQLDKQRRSGHYLSRQTGRTTVFNTPQDVKLQGIILRGKKQPIVFINDKNNLNSNQLESHLSVRPDSTDHQLNVLVNANSKRVKLKPGQQWNESNQQVIEQFQIKPVKPKPEGMAKSLFPDILQ